MPDSDDRTRDLLEAALARHADEAPDGAGGLERTYARAEAAAARRRRVTTTAVPVVATAAVLAVVIGAIQAWSPEPPGAGRSVTVAPSPAGDERAGLQPAPETPGKVGLNTYTLHNLVDPARTVTLAAAVAPGR